MMSFWKLLNEYMVTIPILQRDYAQGRMTGKAPLIRENLLNAVCNAVLTKEEPLELDFIYGYIKPANKDEEHKLKKFYPLDGQQRLTTLYLFHWYIAAKEDKLDEAGKLLKNFSYETRHSSRVFCEELVKYKPENFDVSIKQSIINQPWFFTAWNNDPTIRSMLTMLDAIQEKVKKYNLQNIWYFLTKERAPIAFHMLPMDKLGLPDDLYIKMNSRGKELTDFEYFKSRFPEFVLDPELVSEFNHKIDQKWSDLFWDLYKDNTEINIAQKVDSAFLRFFRYITDIIIAESNFKDVEDYEEFEKYSEVYSVAENTKYIFKILDLFVTLDESNSDFFNSVFYINQNDYCIEKTRLFFLNPSVELFKKCADTYDLSQRNNPFSIGEQLLLYGCILHLLEKTENFHARIRKLRNLISNSEDTVRKENMPSLLKSVKEIIVSGAIDIDSKFNKAQVNEENEKEKYLMLNHESKDVVYRIEDHHLLQGCTAIFDLTDNLSTYTDRFNDVFTANCDNIMVSRALSVYGNYSQKTNWSRFFGSKNSSTWRELFTPSIRRGDYNNTREALSKLLQALNIMQSSDLEAVIRSYLKVFEDDPFKEKDWRYYYIKYESFRRNEEGFYYWKDDSKIYECVMIRKKTLGGFHWDPFLYSIKELSQTIISLDNYGAPIIYVKKDAAVKIFNQNDGFKLEALDTAGRVFIDQVRSSRIISEDDICLINQSINGLDLEDRVERGLKLIAQLNQL